MPTVQSVVFCLGLVVAVASAVTAQHAPSTSHAPAVRNALAPPAAVPIHSPPDDGEAEPRGRWAAGAGYKVSFHDGFVFYPQLSADYPEHLPLRWRTESITVGGKLLIDVHTPPVHVHGPWRYEYQWAGVTEAYDVRPEGVEQSFVIARRPPHRGDLVVSGRVETRLVPQAPIASAHAAITFADAKGQALVRYGEAFAVDALGRRTALVTTCDTDRILLTVSDACLQNAVFPLTIDPLTSPVTFWQADLRRVCIERQNETVGGNVLVTFTTRYGSGDHDAFAVVYDDTFQNPVMVFANFDATANTVAQDSTYAGGADRWVIAYTTAIAGVPMRGRLYFHSRGNATINSGTTKTVLGNNGAEVHESLALGGSEAGTDVLLAYRTSSSSASGIWAAIAAADTRSIGPRIQLSLAQSDPEVSRTNSATDPGWLLTYTATESPSPFELRQVTYATRITPANLGSIAPVAIVTDLPGSGMARPLVDGRDGRFLLAYERRFPFSVLYTRRVDWPAGAATPTIHAERYITAAVGGLITWGRGLAYDHTSRSHWCLACGGDGEHAVRLGGDGSVVEVATLGPTGVSPAAEPLDTVTFNNAAREFQVAFITPATATSTAVAVARLQYSPDAINVRYGTGCNDTGLSIAASRPDAGAEFFTIGLSGSSRGTPPLPNGTPCALILSFASASILDASGCRTLVSTRNGDLITNLMTTMSSGVATVRFPLLNTALHGRDLFGQWWFTTAIAPRGMSAGLRMQVR